MANKSTGKNYTSKGERRSSIRTRGYLDTPADKAANKMDAQQKGKRVVWTIANPNKSETNKPFIRVMYNAKNTKGEVLS